MLLSSWQHMSKSLIYSSVATATHPEPTVTARMLFKVDSQDYPSALGKIFSPNSFSVA